MIRQTLIALSLATPGCTAIVAASNFSVNATVGDPSSAGFDSAVISGLLIGAAAIDVALLVLAASGEVVVMNARQTETDLARGEGPFIDDLAAALALPRDEVPRLGAQLRRHRATLLGAIRQSAAPTVYAENLREALETALAEDPGLTERLHAARTRLSASR